jgi:hypothetical protein
MRCVIDGKRRDYQDRAKKAYYAKQRAARFARYLNRLASQDKAGNNGG